MITPRVAGYASGVDVAMALDVIEVTGLREPSGLKQVPCIRSQDRHFSQLVSAACGVPVVPGVKPSAPGQRSWPCVRRLDADRAQLLSEHFKIAVGVGQDVFYIAHMDSR